MTRLTSGIYSSTAGSRRKKPKAAEKGKGAKKYKPEFKELGTTLPTHRGQKPVGEGYR